MVNEILGRWHCGLTSGRRGYQERSVQSVLALATVFCLIPQWAVVPDVTNWACHLEVSAQRGFYTKYTVRSHGAVTR